MKCFEWYRERFECFEGLQRRGPKKVGGRWETDDRIRCVGTGGAEPSRDDPGFCFVVKKYQSIRGEARRSRTYMVQIEGECRRMRNFRCELSEVPRGRVREEPRFSGCFDPL